MNNSFKDKTVRGVSVHGNMLFLFLFCKWLVGILKIKTGKAIRRSEPRILRVAFPGSAKGRFPDETVPTALLEIEKFRNDAPFIAFARGCLVSGMPLRNQTKGVENPSN